MRFAALAAASLLTTTAHGAEVAVLAGGAVKTAFTAATQPWQAKSGHAVKAEFAPAGEMRKKLHAGEVFDVVIMPAENLDEFEKAGVIVPGSRRPLGAVAIGVAVKQGAPLPDISSPDALKRALQSAKSLTYMDPTRGTSGKFFDETVLPRLGIRDEVRAKATLGEGGFIAEKVARGEVEMAFHQITEMLPVKGITIVGPLPEALQKVTVYVAAITTRAAHPAEATALLDYLAGAEGRKAFTDRGFTEPKG